jgi:hypothetical protein
MPREYDPDRVYKQRRRFERKRLIRDGIHLGFVIGVCFFAVAADTKAVYAVLVAWTIYAAWDVGLL